MDSGAFFQRSFGSAFSHRGFTLIELLVVLAIVAVIVVLASPNYDRVMVNSRLDQERLNLATGLAFARTEAIERGANIRICRNTSGVCGNTNAGTFAWNGGWRIVLDGDNSLLKVVDKNDANVIVSFDCGDFLSYGSTGERAAPGAGSGECTFVLADADDASFSKSLLINATGRVRMQ